MSYNQEKNIELYMLMADNFDVESAPHQKKYYMEAAEWLRQNRFDTAEEAIAAMRQTKYYEEASIAKLSDDIDLRINAMEKVGYEDVAKIHRKRREKFAERGNSYAFSQEWIDDFNLANEEAAKYAKRKEVFGKIFNGYFQIAGNHQSDHRKEGAKEISDGLAELEKLGVTFDELSSQKVYRDLTMTTEKGLSNFINFVQDFVKEGQVFEDDLNGVKEEQEELSNFIREHKRELIEVGKKEVWKRANAIAVPSSDALGYDFIALKEVEN